MNTNEMLDNAAMLLAAKMNALGNTNAPKTNSNQVLASLGQGEIQAVLNNPHTNVFLKVK